ncbi:hypothetical protein VNO80_07703 [Phaseolus coccineus]|uniref:S-protein homolog n=1 Tax=Phaseolus coccineus TaxID=3886 RepID=A0AAN9NKM6_PHACN
MSVLVKSFLLLSMLTLGWAHTDVYITNNLEGLEDLNLHCKSKDDDLGQHVLHNNQDFHISFNTNYFFGTLFFCSFQWGNSPLFHFDVYDQSRDFYICDDCKWSIRKDGPCRFELQKDLSYSYKCYPWKQ